MREEMSSPSPDLDTPAERERQRRIARRMARLVDTLSRAIIVGGIGTAAGWLAAVLSGADVTIGLGAGTLAGLVIGGLYGTLAPHEVR